MSQSPTNFDSPITAAKAKLRAQMRDWRRQTAALSPSSLTDWSAQIEAHLWQWLSLNARKQNIIAIYLATPHEPNIENNLAQWREMEFQIVAPRTKQRDFYSLGENFQTVNGVREPTQFSGGHCFAPQEIDIFILPGLAFDARGGRLGHGGGWYDQMLQAAPSALRVGVAFGAQIVERVPREAHDQLLDWFICENRVVQCKRGAD